MNLAIGAAIGGWILGVLSLAFLIAFLPESGDALSEEWPE